jgi:PBSX family phage terminase large subunit
MSSDAFVCHSLPQEKALISQKSIILLATGIQYGKTKLGAHWMLKKISENPGKGCNHIIVAPTYKIMQQSTLPAFLQVMEGLGKYHKQEATFEFIGGALVYLRTCTEPDSIVGITNVYSVWGDEAGKFSLYFWENMQARAAFKSAQIMLTTSPYSLNWIYKQIIRPKLKNREARPDVEYLWAKSTDNPYFSKEYYQQVRETMDERRFRTMFGGSWEQAEGLVYDCFDDEENTITPFALPHGTKFYAGVDFGYTHPFVIVVIAITPTGERYQVTERYKNNLPVLDMLAVAKQLMQFTKIEMFYCDPSQPAMIAEFNRAGIPAVGANNDIQLGIGLLYEMIKTRRFKLFRGDNKFTLDSLSTYHYKTEKDDIDANTDLKERDPIKQDDDCADALRYVNTATYTGSYRKAPEIKNYYDDRPEKVDIADRVKRIFEPINHDYEEM